jgi:nucleotide-binding universal stress UspA family protein
MRASGIQDLTETHDQRGIIEKLHRQGIKMNRPNHLLAATDFSENSMHAVRRGFLLAGQLGARYTVLHALKLETLAPLRQVLGADADAVSVKLGEKAREELSRLLADPQLNSGVKAETAIVEGSPANAICAGIGETGADLVLLGARGQSSLKRMLLGSTTTSLLHKTKSAVLVVRQAPQGAYHRVLVGVDFSAGSEAAIRKARAIAPQADLVLLHVYEAPFEGMMRYAGVNEELISRCQAEVREQCLHRLHELAAKAGLPRDRYTAVVQHGEPTVCVMEEAEHYGCDLISMGKHGSGLTEELLLGSVTRNLLNESRLDVLVTHE